MSDYVRGWHFVGDRLRDGRPVPRNGVWLAHDGPIVWCESGLYGSRRPSHALRYANGANLCLCDFDGIEAEQHDKLVARRRRIVRRIDATELLRYYARMQALSVAHLWDAPDAVLDYLMTGDESIQDAAARGAREAAWAARGAREAAWAAEWEAAREAEWVAAMSDFDSLVYETMGGADE